MTGPRNRETPAETVRIRVYVHTGFAGATHEDEYEFSREDWESFTESEREEIAADFMHGRIEYGWSYAEDSDV